MKVSNCSNRPLIMPCNLEGLNYQIDPYVGCEHYCYYCYALKYAETNWSEEIQIYENVEETLEKELEGLQPQKIYFGFHSDAYQPVEAELLQTRKVLSILLKRGFSASILTKSNLVVRDIDILKEMPNANVSISVAFDDDEIRKRFESNTLNTDDRIEALRLCKEAGIRTSALICPVIPHITKVETLLSKLIGYADKVWIYGLSLGDENEEPSLNVKKILKQIIPEKALEIESIVADKSHRFWRILRKKLEKIERTQNLDLSINI